MCTCLIDKTKFSENLFLSRFLSILLFIFTKVKERHYRIMSSRKESERTKYIQDKCQILLTQMLRDEDNKYCVDCDAKGQSGIIKLRGQLEYSFCVYLF